MSVQLQIQAAIAAELRRRFPDAEGEPLRSRIVAAAFLAARRTAVQLWVEDQGGRSLPAAIDDPPFAGRLSGDVTVWRTRRSVTAASRITGYGAALCVGRFT
jgi:hypothetical protein